MKKILLFALLVFSTIANAQGTWTQKATFSGANRDGSCCFSIGTKGYLGGGYNGSTVYTDFWEYDPSSNSWSQKASFSVARFVAYSFAINTKGYICMGAPNTFSPTLTDIWEYDPSNNVWNQKANFPGAARYGGASFVIGGKGYICCGNEGSASGPFTNELWEFNPATNSWNQKTNFTGNPRYGITYSSFVIGTKGYVGLGGDASTFYTDFYAWDQTTNLWTQVANYPGSGNGYCCGFGTCFKGYMGTGHNGPTFYSDFWQYNDATNTWTSVAGFGGGNRWVMPSCVINGKAYAGTGLNNGIYYNDWWQYACSDDAVNEINLDNLLSVFPNPSEGKFHIQSTKCKFQKTDIYNAHGEHIYQSTNPDVDLSLQPSGIYFVQIQTDKGAAVKKTIISH